MPVLISNLGVSSCIRSTCIERSFNMSCQCYNIAFKLRAVSAAEGKSKGVVVRDFKVDTRVTGITTCSIRSSMVGLHCGPSEALEEGSHGERQTEIGPCPGPKLISIPTWWPLTLLNVQSRSASHSNAKHEHLVSFLYATCLLLYNFRDQLCVGMIPDACAALERLAPQDYCTKRVRHSRRRHNRVGYGKNIHT